MRRRPHRIGISINDGPWRPSARWTAAPIACRSSARAAGTPIEAASANKYLQQLCKHWSHRLEVDLSEKKGVVRFPAAVVTLDALADALGVEIEGEDSEEVERMKGVVASHLDRFAFREAPLRFDWSGPGAG